MPTNWDVHILLKFRSRKPSRNVVDLPRKDRAKWCRRKYIRWRTNTEHNTASDEDCPQIGHIVLSAISIATDTPNEKDNMIDSTATWRQTLTAHTFNLTHLSVRSHSAPQEEMYRTVLAQLHCLFSSRAFLCRPTRLFCQLATISCPILHRYLIEFVRI